MGRDCLGLTTAGSGYESCGSVGGRAATSGAAGGGWQQRGQGRQHAEDAVEGVADEVAGGDGRRQQRKRREVQWGMIRCAAYAWEEE